MEPLENLMEVILPKPKWHKKVPKEAKELLSYENRITFYYDEELSSNKNRNFYTKSGIKIATGFDRIVFGKRGPYVEFSDKHIATENLIIPKDQEWRLESKNSYYFEFRSTDESNVKVYFQKKLVDYADYRIGYMYISAFDLLTDKIKIVL